MYIYFRFFIPHGLCNLRLSILFTSFSVTIYSFALSAVHRYVTIVHNRGNMLIFQKKWQPLLFAAVWGFTLVTVVPTYATGDLNVILTRDLCFLANPKAAIFRNILLGFSLFLSLFLTPVLYIRIFVAVRKAASAVGPMGTAAKSDSKAAHTARVLFVLYLTYTIAYVPYTLSVYIRQFMPDLATKR